MPLKIVLTGAPGTGKTTVLDLLLSKDYFCKEEVSREIIKEAEKKGNKRIFLSDPILFSKTILDKRIIQHKESNQSNKDFCFFDRGLPDITAYLNSTRTPFDDFFEEANQKHLYDIVFVFPPWKEIYTKDSERFETYDEALKIHQEIIEEYKKTHQNIIIIPKGTPNERLDFLLKKCHDQSPS